MPTGNCLCFAGLSARSHNTAPQNTSQVSYSPTMAKMLSFLSSKSVGYSGFYPDENVSPTNPPKKTKTKMRDSCRSPVPDCGLLTTFKTLLNPTSCHLLHLFQYAREIMQLFTIGLWQLHDNGTRVTDERGAYVPTYGQEDITNFARGWTGFERQLLRGNIEHERAIVGNDIDPLRLRMLHRDMFPKTDLRRGYIGDGLPLCTDLPVQSFLRRGASYNYLGASPMPRKLHIGNSRYVIFSFFFSFDMILDLRPCGVLARCWLVLLAILS